MKTMIKIHCFSGVTQEETLPSRKMVLPLILERVEKVVVSFDTKTSGLLISAGTREQLPALQNRYIQNKTIMVRLLSDILRWFPRSFVVFFFWAEFLWSQ